MQLKKAWKGRASVPAMAKAKMNPSQVRTNQKMKMVQTGLSLPCCHIPSELYLEGGICDCR